VLTRGLILSFCLRNRRDDVSAPRGNSVHLLGKPLFSELSSSRSTVLLNRIHADNFLYSAHLKDTSAVLIKEIGLRDGSLTPVHTGGFGVLSRCRVRFPVDTLWISLQSLDRRSQNPEIPGIRRVGYTSLK
jgi:hypothetical protein